MHISILYNPESRVDANNVLYRYVKALESGSCHDVKSVVIGCTVSCCVATRIMITLFSANRLAIFKCQVQQSAHSNAFTRKKIR